MRGLQAAYRSKDSNTCKESHKICLEGSIKVHVLYKEFTDRSAASSEMVNIIGKKIIIEVGKYIKKIDICW